MFARLLLTSFFVLSSMLAITSPALAVEDPTFDTRLTLQLCPEFRVRPYLALEIMYSVGDDPQLLPVTELSRSINVEENTATVELRFPRTLGTTPFNVVALCRDATSFGNLSNALAVSNCDALALVDTDFDGIPNNQEDLDCNNGFSPGDASNPDNVDTDGDGVRDLVELVNGTDRTNPGSSPRPFIFSSAPFDPDLDRNSNPLVWRASTGQFFVKDVSTAGNHVTVPFGLTGDIPFTYSSSDKAPSDVGVVRQVGNELQWLFHGDGFIRSNQTAESIVPLGLFGDNLVPGPWETPGKTNPAIARLFGGIWTFIIYQSDGSVRWLPWGANGDIPKPQDYDGDGLFDVAVFRPAEQTTYVIRSSDGALEILNFGTGTADHTVKGDYTGDGVDDITFWEPISGMFTSLTSNHGFDVGAAANKDPKYYTEIQLGLFSVHLPLNWNRQNSRFLYTVVDHGAGLRFFRANNDPTQAPQSVQWGLPGDHLG